MEFYSQASMHNKLPYSLNTKNDSYKPRIYAVRRGETDFNALMKDIFDRKDFYCPEYTEYRVMPEFIDPPLNSKGI